MPKPFFHPYEGFSTTGGGMDPGPLEQRQHDLDAHMDELVRIDKIRRKSAQMRTEGHKALIRLSGTRLAMAPLHIQYKHARVAWQYSKKDHAPVEHIQRIERLCDEFRLDAVQRDSLPVLTAAEAMRAFISVGRLAICKETMLCWCWVIREIFTAAKPDWCIGGARAGDNGWVTAYSTSQCVRALCDLARALERTSELLSYMQRVFDHIDATASETIPKSWKSRDKERLARDMLITLTLDSNVVVFDLAGLLEELHRNKSIKKVRPVFQSLVRTTLKTLHREFGDVIDELDRTAGSGALKAESKTGHAIASEAVHTGRKLVELAIFELSDARWAEKLSGHFRSAAEGVREGVIACTGYLSSVIDRQLAATNPSDSRSWEPAELAYAVCAYAQALGRGNVSAESARLKLAAKSVCEDLYADGTIPNRIPFHSASGGSYSVNTEELLEAVADLVRASHWPITERFVTNVQHYFERQLMLLDNGQTVRGWAAEFDHQREEPDIFATVDAVESLGAFNRMLDEGINEIVLEHFTVREPKPGGLRLEKLFYPDYGFQGLSDLDRAAEASKCKIGRQPVAMTMQDMRSHVMRAGGTKSLNSLVLHGPGGTGKTTLIEALANTCNVRMVEVTPSDIAIGGEAGIERRARNAFSALSMLSRVVILFDEFDPVLRRRDETGKEHTNFYSFLTPGMLPKLKVLHDAAKDRSVAFALITNLIGTLDVPAVRKGRFDEAVGIYPPDPLSRSGHIACMCRAASRMRMWGDSTFNAARFRELVASTAGLGMTGLTSSGWFQPGDKSDLEAMPIGYVYGRCNDLPEMPAQEASFDEKAGPKGESPFAQREYMQWGWLSTWETHGESFREHGERFSEKPRKAAKHPEDRQKEWEDHLDWPKSLQSNETARRLAARVKHASIGKQEHNGGADAKGAKAKPEVTAAAKVSYTKSSGSRAAVMKKTAQKPRRANGQAKR